MPNEFKVKNGLIVEGSGSTAGLPILEVYSDNTVRIGQYGQKVLYVSQSKVGIGKESDLIGILDVSGSVTVTGSVSATNFTGSLQGTSSWANNTISSSYALTASNAQTASSVSTLSQNVIITRYLTVGTSSLGSTENTIVVGVPLAGGDGEGGQILLQASGGLYTSASMIDNYQNRFRILRGTNASSDAELFSVNLHSGQIILNRYTGSGAFPGTVAANLAVDTSGNVITTAPGSVTSASYALTSSYAVSSSTATSSSYSLTASYALTSAGGGGAAFPFIGAASITGSLSVTGSIYSLVDFGSSFISGNYTMSLSDWNDLRQVSSSVSMSIHIPSSSVLNVPVGWNASFIIFTSIATGSVTFTTASGVTLRSFNNWRRINGQYGAVTLVNRAANDWYLMGNINA
jgi:hypothetical protein